MGQVLGAYLKLLHGHWSGHFRHTRLEIRIEFLEVDGCPHLPILSSNLVLDGWLRHGGTTETTGRKRLFGINSVSGVSAIWWRSLPHIFVLRLYPRDNIQYPVVHKRGRLQRRKNGSRTFTSRGVT
jgi:hypothetical protein